MFRRKIKISFDVHKYCFCDDDDNDDDGDDDDDDNIAIVHGLKTMVFQTWECFIRVLYMVLHGIVLYCMLPGCIETKEVILGGWGDNGATCWPPCPPPCRPAC